MIQNLANGHIDWPDAFRLANPCVGGFDFAPDYQSFQRKRRPMQVGVFIKNYRDALSRRGDWLSNNHHIAALASSAEALRQHSTTR